MANDVLNPVSPVKGFDPETYQKTIQKTAAATRDVGDVTTPPGAKTAVGELKGAYRGIGETAISQYGEQAKVKTKEAEKAATALEMQGGATIEYLQRLDKIREGVTARSEAARDEWAAAPEKADEYVQAALSRVGEVLTKLDDINTQIGKDRDFSKAHAMQASVQATLGSMRAEERNIVETYGAESKEFEQFQMSKMNSLGVVQSNIHASFQQLQEQQGQNYLKVVSEAYTKSNMYVGFQEQQHVDMLRYKADAQNAYDLKVSQFEIGVEQLRMTGMENLANWIIETPTFSMDATPLMTLLSDLSQTQAAEERAEALTRQQIETAQKGTYKSFAKIGAGGRVVSGGGFYTGGTRSEQYNPTGSKGR